MKPFPVKSEMRLKNLHVISVSDSDGCSNGSTSPTILINEDDDDNDISKKPVIDDWLLIKYAGKKAVKQFTGQVLNVSEDGLTVKFVKKYCRLQI